MADEELAADELADDPFEPKDSFADVTDEKQLQGSFDIKDGRYHSQLERVERHESKNEDGTPKYSIELVFVILSGDHPEEEGKRVRDYLGVGDKSRAKRQLFAVRLGIYQKEEVFGTPEPRSTGYSVFKAVEGAQCIIEVKTDKPVAGSKYKPNPKIIYGGLYQVWDERVKDVPKSEKVLLPSRPQAAKKSAGQPADNGAAKAPKKTGKTKKPSQGPDWTGLA